MTHFFFITSSDTVSAQLLSPIINLHPDIDYSTNYSDMFLSGIAPPDMLIDKFILYHSNPEKKYSGAHYFSAFELHHKTLTEKTAQPYRKSNILMSPLLRINFLLHSWKKFHATPIKTLAFIEHQMNILKQSNHSSCELYRFLNFYAQIKKSAQFEENNGLDSVENKLFLIALARVIAYDSADIPVPGQTYCFEKLLNSEENFISMIHYLTNHQLEITSDCREQITLQLENTIKIINDMQFPEWTFWQKELLKKFLNKRLYTIYYPHIDKPLAQFYNAAGYSLLSATEVITPQYSKLISLQLNSNRPAQLGFYFDNIEETADNPNDIEVLVNIDIGNQGIKNFIENEIPKRKFTLKYIETPKPKSFCDLWQPINKLLEITDPNCYFLLNISDEMLFKTLGWDTLLKKYVGHFPDHLFRLRASRNKFRNYFDRWECSFAQDSIPITTKKWLDVSGNWNPCFGPDSFQQLVSFYLAKEGMFSNEHLLRDIPVLDIEFSGDIPSLGMANDKEWHHHSDHIKAMEICQSPKMQLEARRRAILIKANIVAHAQGLSDYSIQDIKSRKEIQIINTKTKAIIEKFDYNVNSLFILLTNYWRRLSFFNYFGDGKNKKIYTVRGLLRYLNAKYKFIYLIRKAWRQFRGNSSQVLEILRQENKKMNELLYLVSLENKKLSQKYNVDSTPETIDSAPVQQNNLHPAPEYLFPKISIIIGVLNMKDYIANALESVLQQNYPNLELIVMDGGSTDGTLEIIKHYEKHINFWKSEKDGGHCDACNKALDIATGDLIGFLSADDVYADNTFNKVAATYNKNLDVRIITSGISIIKNNKVIHTLTDPHKLQISLKNMIFELSVINARFFHRSIFKEFGKFQPTHADGNYNLANDRNYLIKLALANVKSEIIPEPLYQYLSHESSFTFGKKHITRVRYDHLKLADNFLNNENLSIPQQKIFYSWIQKDTTYLFLYYLLKLDIKKAFSTMKYGLKKCGIGWLIKLPLAIGVGLYRKTFRILLNKTF
ncbi:MAG: PGL/p-HBAD biosynthesis glycosyltransferase [Gammaproteobacteria bacterium]|jgi:glycosyltransferase involved in cell wall biosynthesis|nr:PGL/p-HBAD biosynthesis glycosyltransferase [Gammaproteobacteria bacterium]